MSTSFDNFQKKKKAAQADQVTSVGEGDITSPSSVNKVRRFRPTYSWLLVCLMVATLHTLQNKYSATLDDKSAAALNQHTRPFKEKVASHGELPTIEQAYKNTNVERILLDKYRSKLYSDDKDYLNELFIITDKLVITRVHNYHLIAHKQPLLPISRYDTAIEELQMLAVPERSKQAHALLLGAVKEQREYTKYLDSTGATFNANNPLVQGSQNKLLLAWQLWLAAYAEEDEHNKRSFEKHLCALSFI